MVTNDKIEIDINVHGSKAVNDLDNVSKKFKVFQSDIDSAKGSVDGFDRVIQKFSVQTFAQGLLNISTSAAQVYTSMSNLDRAANQVQSSLVAMHKAEDQIERKQIQLTKAIDQYGYSSEKAAMITEELATAHEQLEVKTERHRLAVDQLRDTQILMVSNLVNTGFGALQTIASLHAMVSTRLKQNTIDTAINTVEKAKQNTVVGLSGAPFAVLNGAITANTAVNRVNMFSQIGLGAAVRANPLMLPLTLATIAVGIGSTVMVMNEMGKTTNRLTSEMNDSSTAVNELDNSWSEAIGSMTEFNNGLVAGATSADGYTAALDRVKTANEALKKAEKELTESKDFWKFKSPEEKIAAAKNVIDRKAQLDASVDNSKKALAEEVKLNLMRKSLYTSVNGVLQDPITLHMGGKMTLEQMKAFESLGDKVQEVTKIYEAHGIAHDIAFTKALQHEKENIQLKGYVIDQVEKQILAEEKLSNTKDKGYKNEKQHLRELQELKKKLSLEYGFIKPGSNRRSFVAGESDYFNDRTGLPFTGLVNKKTNEVLYAETQRRNFAYIDAALDISKQMITNGEWTLDQARTYINNTVNTLNNQRNIMGGMGSTGLNNIISKMTTSISGYIDRMRSSGVLSGIGTKFSSMQIYNPITKSITTTGQYFRDTAGMFSSQRLSDTRLGQFKGNAAMTATLNKTGLSAAGYLSAKGSGGVGSSVAKGGSQSKGRSSKHGGANRADQYNAQMAYNRAVAGMEGVSELTGIPLNLTATFPAGRGWSGRPIYHFDDLYKRIAEANARVSLGNQIMGLGGFDPDVIGTDIYKIDSVQLASFLSREKAQVITQSEKLKMSQESVISLRSSYYGHDELLDRTRFVDKLAQISTGATVL